MTSQWTEELDISRQPKAHFRQRRGAAPDDVRIAGISGVDRGKNRADGVVELLDRLVRLVVRLEEFGALEEGEIGMAVARLQDRAVGGLEVPRFARNLGRFKPKRSDLGVDVAISDRGETERDPPVVQDWLAGTEGRRRCVKTCA